MDKKKVSAYIASGLLIASLGFGGGVLFDQPEVEVKYLPSDVVIVEKNITEFVDVPFETIVEVEDEEFLKMACDRLMFDDIKDCREEVKAENSALMIALSLFDDERELFDLLEEEEFVEDEDEVDLIKVYKDFEDIEFVDSDFDDLEFEFKIKFKVEDEDSDERFNMIATIEVQDNEAEIVDLERV